MSKPRLLIFLNRLSIGGPAVNTLAIAQALCNEFDILVVAGEPAHGEQSADYLLQLYTGFEVKKLSSIKRSVLPFNDWIAYRQIKKIIRTFQPQIVHTHGSKPGVLARFAAWRLKVPVIVHTYHGHVFHSYFNRVVSSVIIHIERWLARRSSFLIAINERLQHELNEVYKIAPASKVILNRLGIDVEMMNDADGSKRAAFRNEFGLSDEHIAIGIIGRLVPVKNHKAFIQLASTLIAENKFQFKFFIVGDGDEKPRLEQLLKLNNIRFTHTGHAFDSMASVIFTSWRRDMDVVLAGLNLVVLTSKNEGTPVSIMEAMAAGKPVIASNVGGIAELFQNNQNGWVYDDFSTLAPLCLKLLESPQIYAHLSQHAKAYALASLTLNSQATMLKRAYFSML